MSGSLRMRTKGAAVVVAVAVALSAIGHARGDDLAAAKALIQPLERDPSHSPITADATSHAREAMNAAALLRSAGDEPHARAADGLALEWAETARELARAANAEMSASDLRRKAVDAQARLERARAQVEEGVARVGRMRAELDEVSRAVPKDQSDIQAHGTGQPARRKAEAPSGKPPKSATSGNTP